MRFPNPSCAVALPRVRNNATDAERATGNATAAAKNTPKAASLQELRAQLRAQLVRNYSGDREAEKQAELRVQESTTTTSCAVAFTRECKNATVAKQIELTALVNRVAENHGFTPEQRQEAQEIAKADPVAALECFREQAVSIPLTRSTDDRIHCTDCAHLRGRVCAQAAMLGASQGYTPVQSTARRCEGFKPLAAASDRRTGAQRWPGLIVERLSRTVH